MKVGSDVEFCRGNCLSYLIIRSTEQCPSSDNLVARFAFQSTSLNLPVYSVSENNVLDAEKRVFFVIFPSFEGKKTAQISVADKTTSQVFWQASITGESLKWKSRFARRFSKMLDSIIDQANTLAQQGMSISPIGCHPFDEEYDVFRAKVEVEDVKDFTSSDFMFNTWIDGEDCSSDLIMLRETIFDFEGVRRAVFALSCKVKHDARNVVVACTTRNGDVDSVSCALGAIGPDRQGMIGGFCRETQDARADDAYPLWFLNHRADAQQLRNQAAATITDNDPLISIVTPVYNPPVAFLEEALQSVLAQSYAKWQLILVDAGNNDPALRTLLDGIDDARVKVVRIEENKGIVGNTNIGITASDGDYVAFLDQDDLLTPDALWCYAQQIKRSGNADLLYCDEDSFTDKNAPVFAPLFKPDFNVDLLYSYNYIVHFLMVSKHALGQVELSNDDVNGAQDYDLTLKVSEVARDIVHVARVLYHWRVHSESSNSGNVSAKPYAVSSGIAALSNHFKRIGVNAVVTETSVPYVYKSTFVVGEEKPMVSIIIPNKDHIDYLQDCLSSIYEKAGYENYEVLIVENNSTEDETFAFYDTLEQSGKPVRVARYDGVFNYSKIINYAAQQAKGDYFLFLNNDTKIISEGFLNTMLGYFNRPEVGVVGPLLLFPDGLVQQSGLGFMKSGHLGFINQNHAVAVHNGYLGSLSCAYDYSSVLGACQMVSRSLFEEIGGYNEDLAVTYNDIDFCCEVRKRDHVVVCCPYVQVMHKEYGSRGLDNENKEKLLQTQSEAGIMKKKWPEYFAFEDPCLPANCDGDSPYFKLSGFTE